MYYLFLILFLLLSHHSISNDAGSNDSKLRVTFCNVGQGNCTLFKFPYGPPLIVDAGSSALPRSKQSPKEYISNELVDYIKIWLEYKQKYLLHVDYPDLNIIISHGDSDHYGWIAPIVTKSIEMLKINSLKIRCLLGGKSSDYPDNVVSKIKQWHKYNIPIFTEEYSVEPDIYCGEEVKCEILSMLTKGNDKNSKSIVLKISYDERSVLLTGDATEFTIKNIRGIYDPAQLKLYIQENNYKACKLGEKLENLIHEYDSLNHVMYGLFLYNNQKCVEQFVNQELLKNVNNSICELKKEIEEIKHKIYQLENMIKKFHATILQASHHGADTDGSNSEKWLEIVSPKFLVFSAGIRADYLHPRLEILKRVSKISSVHTTQNWHSCHVYSEEDPMDIVTENLYNDKLQPYIIFKNGYQIILMKLGAYNTIDQGNITFVWQKGQDVMIETENHNIASKSQLFTNTVKRIIDPIQGHNDKAGGIKIINLRNFNLTEEAMQYIITLIPHLNGIRGISIANNNLGPIGLKYLPEIINKLPRMYYFNIEDNALVEDDLLSLESHWKNRGLVRKNQ